MSTSQLTSGLVSITFRKLSPDEIIGLVEKAGLRCVEWGGDVHCPPDDPANAREVGRRTRAAGLEVAAYGSYYRLGKPESEQPPFERVVEAAAALEAPSIRVWAGTKGSAETDPAERARLVEEGRRIGDVAEKAGLSIAFEYHANTLTDTTESAATLFDEINHPRVLSLWQPRAAEPVEANLVALAGVLPRLVNVHVFHWTFPNGTRERRPLAEGREDWRQYLEMVRSTGRPHACMIEFVRDDDPGAFLRDAEELKRWLAGIEDR